MIPKKRKFKKTKIIIRSGIEMLQRLHLEKFKEMQVMRRIQTEEVPLTYSNTFFDLTMQKKINNGKLAKSHGRYVWDRDDSSDPKKEYDRIRRMVSRKFGSVDDKKIQFLKRELFDRNRRSLGSNRRRKHRGGNIELRNGKSIMITKEKNLRRRKRKKNKSISITSRKDGVNMACFKLEFPTLKTPIEETNNFTKSGRSFDRRLKTSITDRMLQRSKEFKKEKEMMNKKKTDDQIFDLDFAKIVHNNQTQNSFRKSRILNNNNSKKKIREIIETELAINLKGNPVTDISYQRPKFDFKNSQLRGRGNIRSKRMAFMTPEIKRKNILDEVYHKSKDKIISKIKEMASPKKSVLGKFRGKFYRKKYEHRDNETAFKHIKKIVRENIPGPQFDLHKESKGTKIMKNEGGIGLVKINNSLCINCKRGENGKRLSKSPRHVSRMERHLKNSILIRRRGARVFNHQSFRANTDRNYDKVIENDTLSHQLEEWSAGSFNKPEFSVEFEDYIKRDFPVRCEPTDIDFDFDTEVSDF